MTKRTDRSAVHFWTIRKDHKPDGKVEIALPRSAHTVQAVNMPTHDFERAVIVPMPSGNLPDTIVMSLAGRRASSVVEHAIFAAGSRGDDAIITWAEMDELGLKLVLDRPVHPRAKTDGFVYTASSSIMHPAEAWNRDLQLLRDGQAYCQRWNNMGLGAPMERSVMAEIAPPTQGLDDQDIIDADDTPLGQDDQSWRDLTDEQIEEIRNA